MDYIYHGELQIYQHDLDRFLGIAERFKLEGLIGAETQKDEDVDITENILEDHIFEPQDNFPVSRSENQMTKKDRRIAEPTISMQSSDIQSLEDLDQKVEESYSKDSTGLYVCYHCSKSSKNRGHIKEHVEIHFEGLSFPCTMCDAVLRSRHSLRNHKKNYHS